MRYLYCAEILSILWFSFHTFGCNGQPPVPKPPIEILEAPPGKFTLVRVVKVVDLDEMILDFEGQEFIGALSNTLAFHEWGRHFGQSGKIGRDSFEAIRKWVEDQQVFIQIQGQDGNKLKVSVDRYIFGPSQLEYEWSGELPSERVTRGGVNLNVLCVQEGYTLYVKEDGTVPSLQKLYELETAYAKKERKGIWQNDKLNEQLQHLLKTGDGPSAH